MAAWHNDRVQKFSPEGEYITSFGTSGSGPGQVQHPSDVAVDRDGDVYITDWWNHKLEVYDSAGLHITSFRGDAERLSKWAQEFVDANPDYVKARQRVKSREPEWRFNRPSAVEISGDGKVLITDNQRARIQIYQKEYDWVDPQFNLWTIHAGPAWKELATTGSSARKRYPRSPYPHSPWPNGNI